MGDREGWGNGALTSKANDFPMLLVPGFSDLGRFEFEFGFLLPVRELEPLCSGVALFFHMALFFSGGDAGCQGQEWHHESASACELVIRPYRISAAEFGW